MSVGVDVLDYMRPGETFLEVMGMFITLMTVDSSMYIHQNCSL